MKKTLAYYMSLQYPIELRPMEDEDGGWYAHYPDFGIACAHGDGPTIEDAIKEADISKELTIESRLEEGMTIPEPGDNLKAYSGKFNVRVPKSLHARLSTKAQQEGVSLNAYINHVLSSYA